MIGRDEARQGDAMRCGGTKRADMIMIAIAIAIDDNGAFCTRSERKDSRSRSLCHCRSIAQSTVDGCSRKKIKIDKFVELITYPRLP